MWSSTRLTSSPEHGFPPGLKGDLSLLTTNPHTPCPITACSFLTFSQAGLLQSDSGEAHLKGENSQVFFPLRDYVHWGGKG